MRYELRSYQQRAIDELWSWFDRTPDGEPIVEAAVGAGKSLMIAKFLQRAAEEFPGTRAMVLVHQKELLSQNIDKLLTVWPDCDVGVFSASIGRRELRRQITYATIGSVWKRAHEVGRIDLVLADECHLINPKEIGSWRTFITNLRRYNPHVRVVGWTGTPFRGNGVWLHAGEEALFSDIAARVTMRELLDLEFLSPLTPAVTTTRIDSDDVRTNGDDYVVSELAKVVDVPNIVQAACSEIVVLAAERKRWLVFAVTVEHAEHVTAALQARGVLAGMVSGSTPKAERDAQIQAFRRGQIRCLVNVAVLTTGFDVPEVDFIALLRPTKSPVLYVQIAGRGMRIAPGKTDCMWADFTDTTSRMGPVDMVKGRPPIKAVSTEAPTKLCPGCGKRCATAALVCPFCGYPFDPPDRIKHDTQSSGAPVLSTQIQRTIVRYDVSDVQYYRHSKAGSPDSLLVEYMDGLMPACKEWVCLEHSGYARQKAVGWWRSRRLSTETPLPETVDDALEWIDYSVKNDVPLLERPIAVSVDESGKYPVIVGFEW